MKLSQLIENLQDVQKHCGDGYIWSFDNDSFPCPDKFEIELTQNLKRTDYGMSGGKAADMKTINIAFEYEDGVDCEDRCIEVFND